MGLKFGGLDIGQIIENDFRISVLEHLLEWILKTNEGRIIPPSKQVVNEIRQKYSRICRKDILIQNYQ